MRLNLVGYGETRPDGTGSKRCYTEVKVYEGESEAEAFKRAVQFVERALDGKPIYAPQERPFAGAVADADLIRTNQELQTQLGIQTSYVEELVKERDAVVKQCDYLRAKLANVRRVSTCSE